MRGQRCQSLADIGMQKVDLCRILRRPIRLFIPIRKIPVTMSNNARRMYFKRIMAWAYLKILARMELTGARAPKVGTMCVSGWGTRTWIRIAETPLILLDIAGMRSNGFAFAFLFSIVTKLAVETLRKYDQQKIHLQALHPLC
ncbi:hypothetical protein TNCV_4238241 [Trichonephila clavipes]|nr:hypothetical protein TNCV_4238241 [Trichonephila clavipes]